MNDKNNIINSDENYLENEINNLKFETNKMLINTKTFSQSINNSTTNIPSLEPTYITKMLNSSKELIQKFLQDLDNLNEVGKKFSSVDESLKIEATKLEMEVTATKLGSIAINSNDNLETVYSISEETEKILDDITIPTIDLDKYSENIEGGFYLWISSKKYTMKDFINSKLRLKYNYSAEQALEAFIACIIAESDKTIDDTLAVTTVVLNRCESRNWGPYYTNGTNPFDQMFAKGGSQFSVLTENEGSIKRYQKYMPSVVGQAKVDYLLAQYGTTYDTLKETILEALEGGVRNHDYTGYRANGYNGWDELRHISPKGNKYQFENPNIDSAIAKERQARRQSVDLAGTKYNSSKKIMVEQGSNLENLTNTLSKSDNAFKYSNNSNNNTSKQTTTKTTSQTGTTTTTTSSTNKNSNSKGSSSSSSQILNNDKQTVTTPNSNNNSSKNITNSTDYNKANNYNNNSNSNTNKTSVQNINDSSDNPTNTTQNDNQIMEKQPSVVNGNQQETIPYQSNSDSKININKIDIPSNEESYESNNTNNYSNSNYLSGFNDYEATSKTNNIPEDITLDEFNNFEEYPKNNEIKNERTNTRNPFVVAAGITAAIGATAGVVAYGTHEYKKKKADEEELSDDVDGDI